MCNKTQNQSRLCVICDSTLFGRRDKRFCSVKCKNKYHAEVRASNKSFSQDVFRQILRNHRILAELLGENCSEYEIAEVKLKRVGFDFNTVSSIEMKCGKIKLQVLDFTWYLKENQVIHVSYNPSQKTISPYVYKRWKRFADEETHLEHLKSA